MNELFYTLTVVTYTLMGFVLFDLFLSSETLQLKFSPLSLGNTERCSPLVVFLVQYHELFQVSYFTEAHKSSHLKILTTKYRQIG